MNPIVGTLPSFEHMHNQAVAVAPQIPNNGKWALGLEVCLPQLTKSIIFYIVMLF